MHTLFTTSTRIYMIGVCTRGLHHVQYRVINPRTRRPWQAARYIPGQDAYIMGSYSKRDGTPPKTTGVVLGTLPEGWHKGTGWEWAQAGFSTFEKAEAAARAHAATEKPRSKVPKDYGLATKPAP